MNINAIITLVAGLYFVILSFVLNTKNFKSAFVFKVLPFIFGVGCIYVSLCLFDVIVFKI